MNNLILNISSNNGVKTMSSREMVDYINSIRDKTKPLGLLTHENFVVKVKKVLPVTHNSFESSVNYIGHQGSKRTRTLYNFPKREATLMAMSYSYELQAAVLDAWTAAEEKLAKLPMVEFDIPTTKSGALFLAGQLAEVVEKQTLQLEHQAPAVQFHDAVVADSKVYPVGEAAKLLGIGPRKFFGWLRENGYLQKNNVPYANQKDFVESAFQGFVLPNGTVTPPTPYVTSKGLVHFQRKLAKEVTHA